jgi:hypothetical protein
VSQYLYDFSERELDRRFGLKEGTVRGWVEAGHLEGTWSELSQMYRLPLKELLVVKSMAEGADPEVAKEYRDAELGGRV